MKENKRLPKLRETLEKKKRFVAVFPTGCVPRETFS